VLTFDATGSVLSVRSFTGSFSYGVSDFQIDDAANIYLRVNGYRYDGGSILKYNPLLQLQWGYFLGYSWSCEPLTDWKVSSTGEIYFSGALSPREGYCSSSRPSYDALVRKLNTNGQVQWNKVNSGAGDELGYKLAVDKNGDCFVSGVYNYSSLERISQFGQPATFDSFTITAGNQVQEFFIGKLGTAVTTGVEQLKDEPEQLRVFPNPAQNQFTIRGSEELNIAIINTLGQVVRTGELSNSNGFEARVSGLAPGIYFITSQASHKLTAIKVVIGN
jgi:hypothetical protein